ncbi:biotin--[acetyl-CoA-carboxylase] ligase [Clostridium sp. HCP1S3_B4]|uniref:biotin--[acetyl-CoA-carboxylase] ligase n=1 Tax=unclassified Clostridium TaxID=2614128 RepID=UPI003F8A9994|nr:biotin--[acetyl-CoA-carboxylase] ligase [Clostridiales bacterium]
MKEKILKLLSESDDYISGEKISQTLGVTRASVWKHIKTLKEDGYEIDGISKKGYKLISTPDIISIFEINKYLKTNFIAKNIKYYKSLQSTNLTAKENASSLNDGSVIISEIQEGGVGRFKRAWTSPAGGIWFSIILKPNIEPYLASKITIICAAALIKTLNSMNINAFIKWPNDIYVNGKKLCGILTEMKCDMDHINYLVVGIGINANLNNDDFSDEVKDTATSIRIIQNAPINRNKFLANFFNNFEPLYKSYINTLDLSEVYSISKKYSMLINKKAYHVTVRGKEPVTCVGVNEDLELIIKDSNGNIKNVLSGEITFK